MKFVANKFDSDNDPHLPVIGTKVKDKGEITKAEMITAGDLMKMVNKGESPELEGNDEVLIFNNPIRPFVKYLVWIKK